MVLDTAPRLVAAPRPSLTVVGGRKRDRRTEAEELRLELATLGTEIKAYATRIHNAAANDDLRVVGHLSGRLWLLGNTYTDPQGDSAA